MYSHQPDEYATRQESAKISLVFTKYLIIVLYTDLHTKHRIDVAALRHGSGENTPRT